MKVLSMRLVALIAVVSSAATAVGQVDQVDTAASRKSDWDVEALFARTVVIDGNVNYYSPIGSGIGCPDFDKDKNGLSVKEATGINIGAITLGSLRSMESQLAQLEGSRTRAGALRPPKFKGAILIRKAADLDRAVREKKYGILFYCQAHFELKGSIKPLTSYYKKGLRIFQLQYGFHDPNQGPLEKLGGGNDQVGGLTPLGVKVVRELIRLGMVVDLSHCNEETKLDTCRIAKAWRTPVTANHTAARNVKRKDGKFLARYGRNITDKGAKAIADTGGVVAVMAYSGYLSGPYQRVRFSSPTRGLRGSTIDDYVAHIHYLVKLIGADHVGLSTDGHMDGTMAHKRKADGILDGPRRWKVVIQKLHDRGYTDEDLQKIMGLNFLRVYRKVLK